jgi:hypothetical protein
MPTLRRKASVPSVLEPGRAVCPSVAVSEEGPFFYESVKLARTAPNPGPTPNSNPSPNPDPNPHFNPNFNPHFNPNFNPNPSPSPSPSQVKLALNGVEYGEPQFLRFYDQPSLFLEILPVTGGPVASLT